MRTYDGNYLSFEEFENIDFKYAYDHLLTKLDNYTIGMCCLKQDIRENEDDTISFKVAFKYKTDDPDTLELISDLGFLYNYNGPYLNEDGEQSFDPIDDPKSMDFIISRIAKRINLREHLIKMQEKYYKY